MNAQVISTNHHVTQALYKQVMLRAATKQDEPFLRHVYAESRAQELQQVANWNAQQRDAFLDFQFSAQDEHYRQHYHGAEYLIISRCESDIGRLYLHKTKTDICIMDIALVQKCRGQGIGRYLIEQLTEQADRQHKSMSLHVESDNPAKNLYASFGFVKTGAVTFYDKMERPAKNRPEET